MQSKLIIALFVFTLFLVAIVSYVFYTNQNNPDIFPTPTVTATPSVIVTNTVGVTPTDNSRSFELVAQNSSGQDGTVLLEEVDGQMRVTITVANPTTEPQPAHIHNGSCPNPGAVEFPLNNVVNGSSVTTIDTTFDELASMEPLAVNIHKSTAESSVYYSCGDLDF